MSTIRTTCPYCGVGCGVLATPGTDGSMTIKGDPDHPANFGRLCSKGSALGETMALDDRLLHPEIGGTRATWDTALDLVAKRFRETIIAHGPDSVAFYVSGQILTEDYYAANKLMKGFIGSANIDTNSRLCMASSVAGHVRAFGADTVPVCYDDIEQADLVVLVGSNLAWCHPVLFQRLEAARETRGTKVVVIDPRETATCSIADLHLAIAPGTDVPLFNGLLAAIAGAKTKTKARKFIDTHTTGSADAFQTARGMPIETIAETTGLSLVELRAFYELFVATERTVTIYSQGVNQSSAGTDKVNAIINCHLATGRIGTPGAGPFSVTGQPNAMGGREVGGLANMLAAHMSLTDAEHRRIVQSYWRSPVIADKPGLKAVDLFRAVGDGRIKALWIMATNPVDSMPEADTVAAALTACPFVVVSDVARHTDTTKYAHVLLPALGWGEKDGTVTNSERRISRQRAFTPAPAEARADWWQMAEVAGRMGFGKEFGWTSAHEVFVEYAGLTAHENNGRRDLDLGDLATIDSAAYDALQPVQWPRGQQRFFAVGDFFTPDRKARFVATPYRPPALATDDTYPFVLNTGRVRDQWHTMTRTGKTARLSAHIAEPFLEVHRDDAARLGLVAAGIAQVTSRHGQVLLRVVVSERQRRGSVFAPLHWTDQFSSQGRVDTLIAGNVDPVSGQPELKAMPVAVAPFAAQWYGLAVSLGMPETGGAAYWARSRASVGWKVEMAGVEAPVDWQAHARALAGVGDEVSWISYHDAPTGQFRSCAYDGDRLVAAFFAARQPVAVDRSWLTALLGSNISEAVERGVVLAGRAKVSAQNKGPIVCVCFDVGRDQIVESLRGGCRTVVDVGTSTTAGTNCGSCRSEIKRLIDSTLVATPA